MSSWTATDWTSATSLDVARQVADAVLYEGYVLFPYRASAAKNQYRWQWGVVVPSADVDRVGEPDAIGCDVLVRGPGRVRIIARFLRLQHRQVHAPDGTPVDRIDVGGDPVVTWDEGDETEVTTGPVGIDDLLASPRVVDVSHGAVTSHDDLAGGGWVERTTLATDTRLAVTGHREGDELVRLHLRVANSTPGSVGTDERLAVLRRAMVGVHLLGVAEDGAGFASLVDPPAWAQAAAARCGRDGLHPVVVGPPDRELADVVLASPIILPDRPEVAPESPGPSFDATEVDELLALAVMGLTDEERAEARATDPRAAELVDRATGLPDEVLERLHGRLQEPALGGPRRTHEPSLADRRPVDDDGRFALPPDVSDEVADLLGIGEGPTRSIHLGATEVALGSRVRLHPTRRADAHDLFVDGRVAIVEKIVTTVEGQTMLGVTLVDDPAAELHRWYGRFQYFDVDEVEPVDDQPAPAGDVARRTDERSGP